MPRQIIQRIGVEVASGAPWTPGPGPNPPVPPAFDPLTDLELFVYFDGDHTESFGPSLVVLDRGPFNRNAIVPGGVSAPSVIPNIVNGHGVLDFVKGNGQYLDYGTGTVIASSTTPHIVWMVAKPTINGINTGSMAFTYATSDSQSEGFLFANVPPQLLPLCWGGVSNPPVGIDPYDATSAFQAFVARFNGEGNLSDPAAWLAYRNAIAQTLSTAQSGLTNSGPYNLIGLDGEGNYFMDGQIAEFGIAADPGPTKISALSQYLKTKYAL